MDEEEKDDAPFNLKDGISINEAKVSALIVCTFLDFLFIVYCIAVNGDITDNHLFLFQTLIAAVAGVNIADKITNLIKSKK